MKEVVADPRDGERLIIGTREKSDCMVCHECLPERRIDLVTRLHPLAFSAVQSVCHGNPPQLILARAASQIVQHLLYGFMIHQDPSSG